KVLFQLAMAAAVANLTYLAASAAPVPTAVAGALVALAGLFLAAWSGRPGHSQPAGVGRRFASSATSIGGRPAPRASRRAQMGGFSAALLAYPHRAPARGRDHRRR